MSWNESIERRMTGKYRPRLAGQVIVSLTLLSGPATKADRTVIVELDRAVPVIGREVGSNVARSDWRRPSLPIGVLVIAAKTARSPYLGQGFVAPVLRSPG